MPDNKTEKILPVVLSGGAGSRLWPVSRTLYPKQLQSLLSEQSLLQDTLARLSGDRFADPIIICNDEHRFIIAEQAREIGVQGARIVLEPVGRNTAPAAAVAALLAVARAPDAMILILPSDHCIADSTAFIETIETRQGLKIGCIEEVAYTKGFLTINEFKDLLISYPQNDYTKYLEKLVYN